MQRHAGANRRQRQRLHGQDAEVLTVGVGYFASRRVWAGMPVDLWPNEISSS